MVSTKFNVAHNMFLGMFSAVSSLKKRVPWKLKLYSFVRHFIKASYVSEIQPDTNTMMQPPSD